jgi:hypothetical protein
MAKSKTSTISAFMAKPKLKRKGIHSKTKSSRSKNAKNYVKISRGQG